MKKHITTMNKERIKSLLNQIMVETEYNDRFTIDEYKRGKRKGEICLRSVDNSNYIIPLEKAVSKLMGRIYWREQFDACKLSLKKKARLAQLLKAIDPHDRTYKEIIDFCERDMYEHHNSISRERYYVNKINNILEETYNDDATDESRSMAFNKTIRKMLKEMFNDSKIISKRNAKYAASGFVKFPNNVLVHYSFPDYRCARWNEKILIHTVKDENDHIGGTKHYVPLEQLPFMMRRLSQAWLTAELTVNVRRNLPIY